VEIEILMKNMENWMEIEKMLKIMKRSKNQKIKKFVKIHEKIDKIEWKLKF